MYSGVFEEFPQDVQAAINWEEYCLNFVIVFLHECGGITRCQIDKNNIYYSEPDSWRQEEEITHSYCYECSDVETIKPNTSTNNRYVAALSVLQDFYCETGYVQPGGFETWCKERLNAAK
jgi:hypothetical protein